MAKGDDVIRKKKNDRLRKRMRSSESAVSARIAAVIAGKRRRKAGKRRSCEGMCYSLPTLDDPFNDRHGKKPKTLNPNKPTKDSQTQKPNKKQTQKPKNETQNEGINSEENNSPSKFLMVCLNTIKDAWKEKEDDFLTGEKVNLWGLDLWRSFSTGTDVLDLSGTNGTKEQTAWLVSVASDIFARREKEGAVLSCPYLLYLVPTQQKAVEVRSICKPLKSVGIHSVSLHQGASIQHQVLGLKSCQPEFLISTPGRLLELVSLKAIDISSVSILVVDGLGQEDNSEIRYEDKINEIKGNISVKPHVILFGGFCEKKKSCVQNLLGKPINKLSLSDSIECRSAFISQHVHLCASQSEKVAKVSKILVQSMCNDPKISKILLITNEVRKTEFKPTSFDLGNCKIDSVSKSGCFTIHKKEDKIRALVKDVASLKTELIGGFDTVILYDFPSSIEKYEEILVGMSRKSISGKLHAIFSESDMKFADSLAQILARCQQTVPQFLKETDS